MSVLSSFIPEGFRGTERTIKLMREMARMGALDERVRRVATMVVASVTRRDYAREADALLRFVHKTVRYVRDPWTPDGAERVQHPWVTLAEERTGDCVPGRTLLLTEGMEQKAMADVRVGDRVVARGGRVAEVTKKWDKGMKRCLYFVLSNGSVLAATPEHKLFVGDDAGAEEKRAGDVRVGEHLLRGKLQAPADTATDPERVEWARLCGYYAADGWWDAGRAGIAGKDGCPKEAQKDWIVALCQRRGWKHYRHARYVRIDDRVVAEALHEECGHLARGKRIPLHPGMARDELEALYEGLMADSGMQGDGNTRCYSTCSRDLAVQARLLMHLLGFPCSIREVVDHGGFGRDPVYRVYENRRRARPIKVKEVHEGNVEHVYDIETTEGSFYLPESDVVVHNCDDMSVAFAALAGSIGCPYAFRTVGVDPLRPNEFTHVYCMVYLDDRGWVPADPMFGGRGLGWEPPDADPGAVRPQPGRVAHRRDWWAS